MIAERRITIDGHEYDAGDEIWDLGGWECSNVETDGRRMYVGNEAIAKLPPYAPIGSTAMKKTGEVYMKYPDGWSEI